MNNKEHLKTEKDCAQLKLDTRIRHYREAGLLEELTEPIWKKKSRMIEQATTVAQLRKLSEPHLPIWNYGQWLENEYTLPEEEIILWSELSLKRPLTEIEEERYFGLFQKKFPDKAVLIGQ